MSNTIYRNIQIAFAVVALLWAIYIIDLILPMQLRYYGIRPRQITGLSGILLAPLVHGSFRHLSANSGSLFVLLTVALSFSRIQTVLALPVIVIGGGTGVWLLGSPYTVHIGASGVIFGLMGFLLFVGVFQRRWKALLFSVAVFLAYGSVLFSLLRYMPGVSWTSHFFGFLAGILAAWLLRNAGHREDKSPMM